MTRKEFTIMTANVAKRASDWTLELVATGDINAAQRPETVARFCNSIRELLEDIEDRNKTAQSA